MIGQWPYAGTGDAVQYNKRFFHLSSMAARALDYAESQTPAKAPCEHSEGTIRHSPGFGIVATMPHAA